MYIGNGRLGLEEREKERERPPRRSIEKSALYGVCSCAEEKIIIQQHGWKINNSIVERELTG